MEDQKLSKAQLEGLSYRVLQLVAKSMALPSNIKKIHLISLIDAKTNKTQEEVESILQQVKWERLQLSTSSTKKKAPRKKSRVQPLESPARPTQSPPNNTTPKDTEDQYSPELPGLRQAIIKFQNKPNTSSKPSCDRVLRSYNMKRQRPNYSVINDSLFEVIRAAEVSKSSNETQISVVTREERFPQVNVTAKCVTKRYNPSLLKTSMKDQQTIAIFSKNPPIQKQTKRAITFSGYPIEAQPTPKYSYEFIQSIGFRRTDGKISKIKAVVQKPKPKINFTYTNTQSYRNVEVTIQDIINSNIDAQTVTKPSGSGYVVTDSSMFYNVPASVDVTNEPVKKSTEKCKSLSVYVHKKIRAEQSKTIRSTDQTVTNLPYTVPCNVANEKQPLPKIHDVFSKFNNMKDYSQPLYVQVSQESERLSYLHHNTTKGLVLESVYNIKGTAVNQSLLQMASTAKTDCVNSRVAPIMATTCLQECTVTSTHPYPATPTEQQVNLYNTYAFEEVPRVYDMMPYGEQDLTLRSYHEALSDSSIDTQLSQETTNEMVEDALEIISQDGDYMERIGMDIRMQCVICSWAGPKIILEIHVKKEHASEIEKQSKNEWTVTYKLGTLVNQDQWLSTICEYDTILYVVSVKYVDPDCFMCSISMLTSEHITKRGTITLYNKVTGEPFTWNGIIQQVCTNMPYENDPNCFSISLSKLELLPNSANVKLLSRSLVRRSPKVVIGQPELHEIHINLFVRVDNF